MITKGKVPVRFKIGDQFLLIGEQQSRTVKNITCECGRIVYDFGAITEGDANFRLTEKELLANLDRAQYDAAVKQHTQEFPQ